MHDYLNTERLLPELQSAYRAFHSTETAVLKVMADILSALDRGDAFLTLLDLSAAFDTVDHATLLKRMEISYGLKGTLLDWFRSYLTGRKQSVQRNNARSLPTLVLFGGAPRVGPWADLFSTLHCRSVATSRAVLPAFSPLCGRHADIWVFPSLCSFRAPK